MTITGFFFFVSNKLEWINILVAKVYCVFIYGKNHPNRYSRIVCRLRNKTFHSLQPTLGQLTEYFGKQSGLSKKTIKSYEKEFKEKQCEENKIFVRFCSLATKRKGVIFSV